MSEQAQQAQRKPRKPTFNHVAMTVSPDLLDETGRKEILDFYGEVFGWEEMPQMTEDRKRLVLMAYEFGQFVFLEAGDQPLRGDFMDHFGMAVSTPEELTEMLAKARQRAARDDRVTVKDNELEQFGEFLDLRSFYVNFLLPLTVEVQHFDWKVTAPSD